MSARAVILKSKNWDEFNQNLVKLDNKEKGNAFELLTKYLFKVVPKYVDLYKDVWIHNELPQKIKKDLNYFQDTGIDLIAETKTGEYHAIQCKYHSDKHKNVSFKELSTFFTLYHSKPKLKLAYVCSSANGFSKNIKGSVSKQLQYILSDDFQSGVDEYMRAIHKYIKDQVFNIKPFKPRKHQKKAVKEAKEHFKKESRGKLIFPCGAGKSLTGFWFTQELDSKNTLIAVPSLSLIKQTLDVYLREIVANKEDVKWLCICSDDGIGKDDDIVFKTENIGVPCQTDPEYIENWLKENKNAKKIVFTTYQSGKIIAELSKKLKLKFDVGIFDEAHKTVGSAKKLFSHLLFEENISIDKRIFMTATERFYGGKKSEDIISMDDVDIYGDTFSMMTFKEAIEAQPALLTDYKVITIDIKQSEISEFIKENRNVNFSGNWDKDVKSRSLASMLALRKAMKLFPIKNAVSFHSSIKQARINAELQDYITDTYNYQSIDTFTVKGKDPTSLRSKIVNEFADSEKALITNARCLTEGIDVPNIDCIVFADPRRSKVDIVQALGRALRTKKGKDWGYVILPVVYDDKTNEIDNDNFNEILSVVRGLAANDERIVDYFKLKESERLEKSKGGEKIFNFEVFSEYIDESELRENLQIKLWEKLSRFEWLPFEEARKIVQLQNISSVKEFNRLKKENVIDNRIPSNPQSKYSKRGWINWSDWLGIDIRKRNYKYLDYEAAKIEIKKYKLKSKSEWYNFTRRDDFPYLILTKSPRDYYFDRGWISWGDFLGTGTIASQKYSFKNYNEAKNQLKKLNIQSVKEFNKLRKENVIDNRIPSNPQRVYKNQWKSWVDFLSIDKSKQRIEKIKELYFSYSKAKGIVTKYGLKSVKEWNELAKSNKLPKEIPKSPASIYKITSDWESWGEFLGNNNISSQKKLYCSYEEAKKIAASNNIKSQSAWRDLSRKNTTLPSSPNRVYSDKWNGWIDFLSKNKHVEKSYIEFDDLKILVKKLEIKTSTQWKNYCKSGEKPKNIPTRVDNVYEDQWKGWLDFLGNEKMDFLSFSEAKKIVQKEKLKSVKEWNRYSKNKRPSNIPGNPPKKYKDQWKGWADFLGKEKK